MVWASGPDGTFHQNFVWSSASLLCARFMFSSTSFMGSTKSRSKVLMTFAIMPTHTVSAVFSKSVNYISIGRNSTRQPMLESSVGGFLNLREFQLVDWRFSKCEFPSIGGHLRNQAVQIPPKCLSSTPFRIEEQEVTSSLFELDTESLLNSSSADI